MFFLDFHRRFDFVWTTGFNFFDGLLVYRVLPSFTVLNWALTETRFYWVFTFSKPVFRIPQVTVVDFTFLDNWMQLILPCYTFTEFYRIGLGFYLLGGF